MREAYVTEETWIFNCPECGHRWPVSYEVRHVQDPDGDEWRFWCREGLSCTAPSLGTPCLSCRGLRVMVAGPGSPELAGWRNGA